jgi:hypothetical protein
LIVYSFVSFIDVNVFILFRFLYGFFLFSGYVRLVFLAFIFIRILCGRIRRCIGRVWIGFGRVRGRCWRVGLGGGCCGFGISVSIS